MVFGTENLKEETLAILAFIYRKYLALPEEREVLEKEYQEKLKQEREKIKNNKENVKINYTPKVISHENRSNIASSKVDIIEYTKEKWYRKLIYKIKSILKINQ